jgi:hypothetical protein
MNHMLKNWPHFVLSGEFDPDAITARLGIEPTATLMAGTLNAETCRPIKASYWVLACGDEEAGCDVQDQVVYMLSQLNSCKTEIAALCEEYRGDLNLFACLDGTIPGFWLDAPTLKKLAQLNVDVDCQYIRSSEIEGKGEN